MTAVAVLRRIVGLLESAHVPYMVAGSFASSFHGTPRTTQDIDVVVFPTREQLRALIRSLPATEYYSSEAAALEALERRGQFNVIDLASGWKVDFIVGKDRPFSREEFRRRLDVEFMGMHLALATAEDTIVAKLEWARLGNSRRQLEDVAAMLQVTSAEIDMTYLLNWVQALDLAEEWGAAGRLAGLTD